MKKFQELDEEKKSRILEAALLEFAEEGYEKASTNNIVKQAGIGKGMLFYYFKNKKQLYHYLVEYSLTIMQEEYMSEIDISETDFIERMKEVTRLKWEVYVKHPAVFRFASTFFLSDMDELPERLKEQYASLQENGYALIYKDIDYTLFREDVSSEKLFQIIQYFLGGYEERLRIELKQQLIQLSDFDSYVKEFFEYLDVLKVTFYKEERQ
ncbi:TetR/AcrR family transcriptional regulator [Salimicrobium halophilum]|uniref:DNA-binding transcriptional regulator, AcrR family n=1 Tax=Salimicrobium halophilum TaxID=86666 RepID=A0A1G8UCF1_9BACI|nr:TetR/AcrR family transcriptional regulator [Salimicrobium halophilum]SDJ50845.1 DNA-binding transcriptional regulator, AcrR family [Salimicrobium halophilum]